MTYQDFPNYSVRMEAELKTLEDKVSQLVALCQQLREENIHLRQQLASAQNSTKEMNDKLTNARTRLESLLARIPEDS